MVTPKDPIIYEFDNFRLDPGKRLLFNGVERSLSLTPKAFDTLLYLVTHNGRVIGKDELMSAIWPDTVVEENNLNKNISALRQVLGEKRDEHRFIATVPGKGFQFVADVQQITARPTRGGARPEPEGHETPSRIFLFAAAGLLAVIAVLAFTYPYFTNRPKVDSIAVMPFANESGNAELEYLSDGMTETLSGRLSKLPGLKVKATSSVSRYKDKNTDAPTVGKELNVSAVLYGWVVQRGEDLKVRVELVDAQTENILWEQTYNRKMSNLIVLQGDVARDLVRELRLKVSGADEQKLAKNYTENVEAYQLFLKGRFHLRKLTRPEIEKGISFFEQAVTNDPTYALAYAGMAEAYRGLAMAGEMPPNEVWPKAKAATQRAVEIDGDLAEGHSGLGSALFFNDWNWAEAENQFLRALELDPNSSMAHFGYADFLGRMGRGDEGRAHLKRAREIEPLSPFLNAMEAGWLVGSDSDAAMERVRFAIDLDPNFYFAHMIAGSVYRNKKMYPEAIAEYRLAKQLGPDQTWSDAIGLVPTLLQAGQPDEARTILDEMLRLSKSRFVPPYNIALVYKALGENDKALAWLEKGYEQRDPRMTFLKTGPSWKDLRGDPRFQDLLRRVGFPPD